MLFEFFGKSYDSKQDKQAESYFKKMQIWIKDGSEAAKIQLKGILEQSKYAVACLLEGAAASFDYRNQLIVESWSGENRKGSLSSATDEQIDKALGIDKQLIDHSLDQEIAEAFGESKKKKEVSQTLTLDQQIAEAMK